MGNKCKGTKVYENYLKSFFKDGMELELTSEKGKILVDLVLDARNKNAFIKETAKNNNIWGQYFNTMKKFAQKNTDDLSKQQAKQYILTFEQAMRRIIPGYNIPEAEAILKIVQRDDMDITQLDALDQFTRNYEKERENPNTYMVRKDEVFSIILDYDILLENIGLEKECQYSPVREMVQALRTGKFGENNSLSKEEFAFALKMLQNPDILDSEVNQKLCEMLEKTDIQLSIGNREITSLLEDKEMFDQISELFPNLQDVILKQVFEKLF